MKEIAITPDTPKLVGEKSDQRLYALANGSLSDILLFGLSPIVFKCNKGWFPFLKQIEQQYGYCWEWLPIKEGSLCGEVKLTKVS